MAEINNKFGLRQKSTGQLVGYEISSNSGGGPCSENQYLLELGAKKIWMLDNPRQVEHVRLNSTPWYNAEYDSPTNDIDPDDLEVIEINMTTNLKVVKVSIPTPYAFLEAKYAKKDPKHWEHLKKEIKDREGTGSEVGYSWHSLTQHLLSLDAIDR